VRGSYETEAFFCFHHVNAFERADGSELVVDLVAYADPSVIDALYLDERGPRASLPPTELRRYVIGLEKGTVSWEVLAENVELPRIDYGRRNGRDYRYAYCTGNGEGWIDRLVKVDVREATSVTWSEPDCYPGEPVFVRNPSGTAEDDGVVLSVVLDVRAGRSFLLVLDAGGFHELARAQAPHHIPFGFHGIHVAPGSQAADSAARLQAHIRSAGGTGRTQDPEAATHVTAVDQAGPAVDRHAPELRRSNA